MKTKQLLKNQEGFTLVEIIAVLIILGILAAVAVPRYIDLEENAKDRAIDAAISELNGRESLTWADIKIGSGWSPGGDSALWTELVDGATSGFPFLGDDYVFTGSAPTGSTDSYTLSFKLGTAIAVVRSASSNTQPGQWKRSP